MKNNENALSIVTHLANVAWIAQQESFFDSGGHPVDFAALQMSFSWESRETSGRSDDNFPTAA